MISLSRIYKASNYVAADEKLILQVKAPPPPILTDEVAQRLQESFPIIQNAEEEARTIISDAEEMAQKILAEASRQSDELREQVRVEMEQWRQEHEQEAQLAAQQAREEAKEEGFFQGIEEGKIAARKEEEETIQLARDILTEGYRTKETIINQAEPFLVELSMEIARKIIGEELSTDPEKIVEMVKKVVRRSRVHGQITISVNHRYYQFIEEHRTQFLTLLDGQAELAIYPDYTVQDEGCVIRTPFGSVDARIDTQLEEIRQVLLDIARGSESNNDFA
ncbi:flagellar assembly protein FliH [Brevibacillus ginsengisoli]|uniref:flagellar assembly protein FliH n=1 Tax=Brevibacillus ginsengisoli TaxID=363854 RepID=UPI003CF8855C